MPAVKKLFLLIITACLLFPAKGAPFQASDFHWVPPFLATEEKPSVTFVLDTSANMLERAYDGPFNATDEYYGYFDSRSYYNYDAGAAAPHFYANNDTGRWNGNFLNWATMRRMDLARKLMTGGKYNPENGCLEMEAPDTQGKAQHLEYDDTIPKRDLEERIAHMTPHHHQLTMTQQDDNDMMLVSGPDAGTAYALRVKSEPDKALLHTIRNKARIALFAFGGTSRILQPMSDDEASFNDMIITINSVRPTGWAPLATALHEVLGYLGHDDQTGLQVPDPFHDPSHGQNVPCSKQNVILVTAGKSSQDQNIPAFLKNIVPRPRPDEDYGLSANGSTFLIDVAYTGHTTDLRPEPGMDGVQNWDFYAVCLGEDGGYLIKDAARHGKFNDLDGDLLPSLQTEFDANGDGLPDNFFTARSGRNLETQITRALRLSTGSIASGTATAIASHARSGEGAAYQAIYFPPNRTDKVAPWWAGQVHAFLIDAQGNLREDTNANQRLDPTSDRIIEFGEDLIHAHVDANGDGVIDAEETNATALGNIGDIEFLWSSSTWLNSLTDQQVVTQRGRYASVAPNRYIMTFTDKNQDMIADAGAGEIQHFELPATPMETSLNSPEFFHNLLTLYESASGKIGFDLFDPRQDAINALRQDNPSGFSNSQATLAKRQVDFIRGAEIGNATIEGIADTARSRRHGNTIWRLGDIISSSPNVVGQPAENYHLIYNDKSYERFLKKYLDRRQVIYIGANDGMLHAFNGGFWNSKTGSFDLARDAQTQFPLGMELWAYVPYNLLPHLKWLMNPDYGEKLHVAYMDLTPKIFDARIFFMSDGVTPVDETTYPGGWGTILVAGMRLGGAAIQADIDKTDGNGLNAAIDRTMTSAYVIMDITDPESPPNVLAEISLPGQGFTTCAPAIMPMSSPNAGTADQNRWYMVFGSGPADATGQAERSKLGAEISGQPGQLFVLDLSALYTEKTVKTVDTDGLISETSKPFAFAEENSFISDPICLDLDIGPNSEAGKFKTDIVYYGTVGGDQTAATGRVHRLQTGNKEPWDWATSTLIDAEGPVSAAPTAALDEANRLWIFFGTGSFLNRADIPQSSPMSFYGIREPETNGVKSWETIASHNLFESNKIAVTKGTCGEGEFSENCVGIIQTNADSNSTRDWAWLSSSMDSASGWKHTFEAATERLLSPAAVLGGSVIFTSYEPLNEACSSEGASRLWAFYYKTGTPYFWPILENHNGDFPTAIELGQGLGANPSLHLGEKATVTAVTNTSSGTLLKSEITTPCAIKSGSLFWRKNTD